MPVPLSATMCGLPLALSVMETLPVKSPSAVGANVTVIVHVALAARLEAQSWVSAKGSVTATPVMRSSADPVLLNVMACPSLTVPRVWLPNEMLGTDKSVLGDPATDKLAVGDPPQATNRTTPQTTSGKYLRMVASPRKCAFSRIHHGNA